MEHSLDRKPFSGVLHPTLQECAPMKMDRKEQKGALLPSSLTISRQRKWAGACGGTVMWFQCLSPSGIIPSGGKPLRLCWHVTPPIINSRSAFHFYYIFLLFFLLHAISFHLCPWLLHLCSPTALST